MRKDAGGAPRTEEAVLNSHTVQIERKTFEFELRENRSGKLVKVIEMHGDRRHSVIIPHGGLEDVIQALRVVAG